MARPATPERMDDPGVGRDELEQSFRFIRRINRHLGGTAALRRFLARESADWPRSPPIRLLDLGTGAADIPVAIGDWAKRRGFRLETVGLDDHPGCLAVAREAAAGRDDLTIVEGDARQALDRFGPASFDYVHAGMFLHHLSDGDAVRVLAAMGRIATRAIVWNDLWRSPTSRLGVWLLTLFSTPMVRFDARLSVEKGFTPEEAHDLAAAAGLRGVRFRSMPLAGRFLLTAEGCDAA
jgi:hypothetical protein